MNAGDGTLDLNFRDFHLSKDSSVIDNPPASQKDRFSILKSNEVRTPSLHASPSLLLLGKTIEKLFQLHIDSPLTSPSLISSPSLKSPILNLLKTKRPENPHAQQLIDHPFITESLPQNFSFKNLGNSDYKFFS